MASVENIEIKIDGDASSLSSAITKALENAGSETAKAITTSLEKLTTALTGAIGDFGTESQRALQQTAANAGAASEAVKEVGTSFGAIPQATQAIVEAIAIVGTSVTSVNESVQTLIGSLSQAGQAGREAGDGVASGAAASSSAVESLVQQSQTLAASIEGYINEFKGLDPNILKAFGNELQNIKNVQKSLSDSTRSFTQQELRGFEQQLAAARASITGQRTLIKGLVDTRNQATREQIVQAQIAAKQESDAVRTSAQIQVATAQTAARLRVANIQGVVKAFQSAERLIRTFFQGTVDFIGRALSGIAGVASSAARGLTSVFQRSNQEITNTYSKSFQQNNQIVDNSLSQQTNSINNFVTSANNALSRIGVGGLAAAGGIGALIGRALTGGFRRQALLEESERSLTILLGDAEKATELKERVLDVVRGTPFRLDQFADAAAQLVAFNVEADKVPRFLAAIGDAAAVKGGDAAQAIDTLVRVFGQVTTTARISLTDINSIAGTGVPALDILGNQFGVTAQQMREMISSGAIPAQDALDALTDGILNGTDGVNGATAAFGGLAKELGNTTRGAIANFGTAIDRLGANVITQFRPVIISFVGFATQLVDAVGAVVTNIATTIANSPIVKLLVRIATELGTRLSAAIKASESAIKALSDGLLFAGTAIVSFLAIRRIPAVLALVQFALQRLLTPINLLIFGLTALGAFFSRLVNSSEGLREALGQIRDGLRTAFEPIGNLITKALPRFIELIGDGLTVGLKAVSDVILQFLVPAFQRVAAFITGTLVPAVRRVADQIIEFGRRALGPIVSFINETFVPVLQTGFRIVLDAIEAFVNFVGEKILPVVVPALQKVGEVARTAFSAISDFVVNKLVPGLKQAFDTVRDFVTNFIEVVPQALVQLGKGLREAFNQRSFSDALSAFKKFFDEVGLLAAAAGATIALFFINPWAGILAAGAAVIAASFGKNIISGIQGVLKTVLDSIVGFFTVERFAPIAINFLKIVERIGRALGNIVSDPRVVGLVAAFGALAVTIAGAFTLGFVRGIAENLPKLVQGFLNILGKALQEAAKALLRNPALILALSGLIVGARALAAFRRDGQTAGAAIAKAVKSGVDATAKKLNANTGTQGFLRAITGGPEAIRAEAARVGNVAQTALRGEISRLQRILTAADIKPPPLLTGQTSIGRFAQDNARNVKELSQALKTAEKDLGSLAAIGGLSVRRGFQNIFSGIADGFKRVTADFKGFLNTGERSLQGLALTGQLASKSIQRSFQQIRTGFLNVVDGIKLAGRQAFAVAGTIAGAAFAASFGARLLLTGDSISDKLSGALGLAATGIGVAGALGFTPVGIAAGGAAVGVGLLTAALQKNAEKAREAEQRIKSYADILQSFEDPKGPEALLAALTKALGDLDRELKKSLVDKGISIETFLPLLEDPSSLADAKEKLASYGRVLAPSIGDGIRNQLRRPGGFFLPPVEQLVGEVEAQRAKRAIAEIFNIDPSAINKETYDALRTILVEIANAADDIDLKEALTGADIDVSKLTELATATGSAADEIRIINGLVAERGLGQFTEAASFARQELERFAQIEISAAEESVREAETALRDAEKAAQDARTALIEFLLGDAFTVDLEVDIAKAVVSIDRTADSLEKALTTAGGVGAANVTLALKDAETEITSILNTGIAEGLIVDRASAEAALAPIISLLQEKINDGGNAGAQDLLDRLIGALDQFEDEGKFTPLIEEVQVEQSALASAQEQLNRQEIILTNLKFEFGQVDFRGASVEIVGQLTGEINSETNKATITRSASQLTSDIADGVVTGFAENQNTLNQATSDTFVDAIDYARSVGLQASSPSQVAAREIGLPIIEGVALGLTRNQGILNSAIRRVIEEALRVAKIAAESRSPSQLFAREVGLPIIEGIGQGIEDGLPAVKDLLEDGIFDLVKLGDDSLVEFVSTGNAIADAIGRGIEEGGVRILSSLDSVIRGALDSLITDDQLFEQLGQKLALTLFQGQLTGGPGFPGGTGFDPFTLEKAFFEVLRVAPQLEDALVKIRDEFGEAARTFDTLTEAGRQNREVFFDAGQKIRDYAATLLEAGRPLDDVIFELKTYRDQLIAVARQSGATEAEILSMLQALALTDEAIAGFTAALLELQRKAKEAAEEAARVREEEQRQREAERAAEQAARAAEQSFREQQRAADQAARDAQRAAEERAREAERAAREAEERARREMVIAPARVGDIIINTPSGDPEAVALAVANRVAYTSGAF